MIIKNDLINDTGECNVKQKNGNKLHNQKIFSNSINQNKVNKLF